MQKLCAQIVSASQRWRNFVFCFALIVIFFVTESTLNQRFKMVTGIFIFDTNATSTPTGLLQELFLYRGAANRFYLAFALFDLIFPILIASFTAMIWALLLRKNSMSIAQRLLGWNLPAWTFLEMLFDWTENISLLIAVYSAPRLSLIHDIAVLAKQLKWTAFIFSLIVTVLLLLLLLINKLFRLSPKYDV